MKLQLKVILRLIWNQLDAIMLGFVGLAMLFAWVTVPSREGLTEVSGALSSYTIEADDFWLARRPKVYVLFKVDGQRGRFWSDAVSPSDVSMIFPQPGVLLKFYVSHSGMLRATNGDAYKSWGMTVNDHQIESVDEALAHDNFFTRWLVPLGVIAIVMAIYGWQRIAAPPLGVSLRSNPLSMTPNLSFNPDAPRRRLRAVRSRPVSLVR